MAFKTRAIDVPDREMIDAFVSNVQITSHGCWEWQGRLNPRGYGEFSWRGTKFRAHRLSYVWSYGPVEEGLYICHHCDNPSCVCPNHLFAGTPRDNVQDAIQKGRRRHTNPPRGERSGKAKLTSQQVYEIRKRYTEGESSSALANEYGINPRYVVKLVKRERWAHLQE